MQDKTDSAYKNRQIIRLHILSLSGCADPAHIQLVCILKQRHICLNVHIVHCVKFPYSRRRKMYEELLGFVRSVKNPRLNQLLSGYFVEDKEFAKAFQFHSAAKTVHHGFVGGLLEHTLSVVKLCDYYAGYYKTLNRDLLLTAAIFQLSVMGQNTVF